MFGEMAEDDIAKIINSYWSTDSDELGEDLRTVCEDYFYSHVDSYSSDSEVEGDNVDDTASDDLAKPLQNDVYVLDINEIPMMQVR